MSAAITAAVGGAVVGGLIANQGQQSAARAQATAAKDASAVQTQANLEAMDLQQQGLDRTMTSVEAQQAQFNRILANATSPQAIQALNSSIASQEQNVQRQAELFNSIDPAVMEASEQALSLLKGEDARSLAPLREERKSQRQALVNRLREQLGPGGETSTAGIQALNEFDRQTSSQMNRAQQASLGQLFGIAQMGAAGRGALNQSTGTLGSLGTARGNLTAQANQTRLGALAGIQAGDAQVQQGFSNVANARIGVGGAAAGAFAAPAIMGAAQGQIAANTGNMIANTGGILGGYFANNPAGGSGNTNVDFTSDTGAMGDNFAD